ncbi:hypothetical protein D9M69_452010 [compost metagenome]
MNVERLERLCGLLKRVKPEGFDLSGWGWSTATCGTVACAVGWATQDPWFRREGLRSEAGYFYPIFEGEADWDAVELFFELSSEEAEHLFSADRYPVDERINPLAVAARIREFVANGGEV